MFGKRGPQQQNGVRRRTGVVDPGELAAFATPPDTPASPSSSTSNPTPTPPHPSQAEAVTLQPISIGAEEMSWADAGSQTLFERELPPPAPLPAPSPEPPPPPPPLGSAAPAPAPAPAAPAAAGDEVDAEEGEDGRSLLPRKKRRRPAAVVVPQRQQQQPLPSPLAEPQPQRARKEKKPKRARDWLKFRRGGARPSAPARAPAPVFTVPRILVEPPSSPATPTPPPSATPPPDAEQQQRSPSPPPAPAPRQPPHSEPPSHPPPHLHSLFARRLGAAVSLPNMDSPDLQLTPESSQNGGDLSDSSFTDVEGGEDEEDEDQDTEGGGFTDEEAGAVQVPLRNARRKSVMPRPPSIKVNDVDFLDVPEHSPGNSITSINSIASLLKEKLALTLPSVGKKNPPKSTREYKLHIFVGFLFVCIVSLVVFAYVFYHQQVLQRAYFERIRFNNHDRIVRVFNDRDAEIMYGFLGENLGHDAAFSCLPRHKIPGTECMEWMHKARLYMNYKEIKGSRCYRIVWDSLNENIVPVDCYDWSTVYGHWYGGGQTSLMQWPVEYGEVKMAPFVTGNVNKYQWGNVVKRYFINSNGVIIFVDPNTPLYISVNETNSKRFCLQAKHDSFAYDYHHTPFPRLNYTICTSSDMTSLRQFPALNRSPYNMSTEERDMIEKLMTEPVWHIIPSNSSELTEKNIFDYSEEVLTHKFLKHGHILINEFWQEHVGDFVLDTSRFPKINDTIDILHRRGFRIIFSIQPFISTEAITFKETVIQELLVQQRGVDHYIPALTRYKSVLSAGMLDVTKETTLPWLENKLKLLVDTFGIDSFFIDIGTAYDVPHYYKFENHLANPDEYKTVFMDSISSKIPIVGVSSAITRPYGPIFISLPSYPSTWESLQSIITTVLTYGIIGFPLIMPGPIGGNDMTQMFRSPGNNSAATNELLPEKELYMRWMQLSAFLPIMSYSHLPQKYGDERVLILAESMSELRENQVNPIVKKYLKANGPLEEGLAFNLPLWMLDPKDPVCHTVVDEFSVGNELIVAPIIKKNSREREIYLPAGVWKDGNDGSVTKGSRWLHHYVVEEHKIAFFIRMPDDTRF